MSENKRYYWLKLKEDFFEDDTIQWIEEQENGKEYSLFYLKLCLKSLGMDGKIARVVGKNLMPYDRRALSKATNTDVDTVVIALELFKRIGLVEILESGEIFMTQIDEMVGSETDEARKKRRQRANIANNKLLVQNKESGGVDNVPGMSDESPPEYRELDLRELDLKRTTTTTTGSEKSVIMFAEEELMIRLSPIQMEKLFQYADDFIDGDSVVRYAIGIAADKNKRNFAFVEYLLRDWLLNKAESLESIKAFETEKFAKQNYTPVGKQKIDFGSYRE